MSLQIINQDSLIGNCCFNGSIFVKHISNNNMYFSQYILKNNINFKIYCIYRSTPTKQDYLQSSMRITPLNIYTMECDKFENIILFENISHEDPRVMCLNNQLFISYSKIITFNKYSNLHGNFNIKIYGSSLNSDFEEKNVITFDNLNNKSSKQKNWTFFEQDGLIYILYNIMPLEIFIWNHKENINKCNNVLPIILRKWKHPIYPNIILRGGCPPILIDNIYYVFVHSVDYKIFCITLDNIIFDILQITKTELIIDDKYIKNNTIYFPCGVIYDFNTDIFYISLGVDDIKLGIVTIPKIDIDNILINADNYDSIIFKDDTINDLLNKNNMNLWINSWGGCENDIFVNYLYKNGIKCKNMVWDKLLCHSVKYFNTPLKKIYIIDDPLTSLSKMYKYKNQYTNLCKLSNQKNIHFSFTALLYFMWIQLKIWVIQKDVYIIKDKIINPKIIEDFIGVDNILNNYPINTKDKNKDEDDTYLHFVKKEIIIENYDITEYIIENIMILYNSI